MKIKRIATVHILLDTVDENEAADMLSGLLTECGIYGENSGVIEWAYTKDIAGQYQYSKPIEIPDDSEADLADFIADHFAPQERIIPDHRAACVTGRQNIEPGEDNEPR